VSRLRSRRWVAVLVVIVLIATAGIGYAGVRLLSSSAPTSGPSAQVPLDSHTIPQFVQALPVLDAAGGSIQTLDGTKPATVRMCETSAHALPPGTIKGNDSVATTVWAYVAGDSCPTGVRDTYTGPVVLAKRGTPTTLTFINQLGTTDSSKLLAYKNSVDQTLFWADPKNGEVNACDTKAIPAPGSACAANYQGAIPATVHLHGGEVPPEDDGGPDSWYTSDGKAVGPEFYSKAGSAPTNTEVLTYPNTQQASPIWFHDHTMGATRLNVYAGLAGGYLIADDKLKLPDGLAEYGLTNNGTFEPTIPLVVQDRMFDTNGQLYFPAGTAGGSVNSPNPDHPYWVPEFIGDTILVNGKAWPFLNVEPKRYRFLLLDGSNARSYAMSLVDPDSGNPGPAIWVIGTDGGYLDSPARIDEHASVPNQLLMMPGERYEVVVDFNGFDAGVPGPNGKAYSGNWVLQNSAAAPYPSGDPIDPATTGKIIEFKVGACTSQHCGTGDTSFKPAAGTAIRTGDQKIVRLVNPDSGTIATAVTKVRALTLNEIEKDAATAIDPTTGKSTDYPGGPLEVVLNNSTFDGGADMALSNCKRQDFTPVKLNGITMCVSEQPLEGDTEVWEIVNQTVDAHPIHLHLVQFQLLNRQNFDNDGYKIAYDKAFPTGKYQPEYGPPLSTQPSAASGGTLGGNPDFTPFLQGAIQPPTPDEAGWKDTVMAPPGTVTRFVVRFAPTDVALTAPASQLAFPFDPSGAGVRGYVWHCHIVDHEDNEMMRPYDVTLNPAAPGAPSRSLVKGRDY
jgi:spore coat protein A